MAGPNGYSSPLDVTYAGATGPGMVHGDSEVLGRRVPINATTLSPQFADPWVSGRPANIQVMQAPYDPPVAFPSRAAVMPRAFSVGIQRITSVTKWPNFAIIRRPRSNWVGMTGAPIPKRTVGWGEPRKNIVANPGMPYGSLTALYPHIYADVSGSA